MQYNILALGGDGIGPEVLAGGLRVAEKVAQCAGIDLEIHHDLLHGACWEEHGTFCRDETVVKAKEADAVLVGAIGGPRWFYPAGYCALGNALPNAIGAKFAQPQAPVAVLAGDSGFMFTMPELLTAAQAQMNLPIIIWDNDGLRQIQDDMDASGIVRVDVEGINPDFVALAKACGCNGITAKSESQFKDAFASALDANQPTLIVVRQQDD